MGLQEISSDSFLIFGGYQEETKICDVLMFQEKPNGALSIRKFKDSSGNLQVPDIFKFNGVAVEDPTSKELIIPGYESIHAFN